VQELSLESYWCRTCAALRSAVVAASRALSLAGTALAAMPARRFFITPLRFDIFIIAYDRCTLVILCMMMRRLEEHIVVDDKLLNGSRHRLSGCGRSTQLPREIHAEEQFIHLLFSEHIIILYYTTLRCNILLVTRRTLGRAPL